MEPITGSLLAGGAQLLGGALGKIFGSGDKKKAQKLLEEAMKEIEELGLPPDLSGQLVLEKFKSAGMYSPELEQEINQQVSKVAGIKEDPRLKDAQLSALDMLQKSGRTGLTATDRAAYNKLRQESQRDQEAKRQQIIQNMQERGQAGGNAELQASLLAAQGGADEQAAAGDELAARASERALQAIMQGGQLGGQMRGQDLDYNRTVAEAADEMERFNINNAVNRQQRNVGAKNEGQQYNLSNQQQIMNANAQMANEEARRQSDASRQFWNDKLGYAQSVAQAKTNQAGNYSKNAAQTAQNWGNIGNSVAAGVGAYANAQKPTTPVPAAVKPASVSPNLVSGGGYIKGEYEDEQLDPVTGMKMANTNLNNRIG